MTKSELDAYEVHCAKYDVHVIQSNIDHLLRIAPSYVWWDMYHEDVYFNTGSYKNTVSWKLARLSFWDSLPRLALANTTAENVCIWKAHARYIARNHTTED